MPNTKNTELVQELRTKVAKSKSIIFANIQGLKSNDTNDLRQKLKDQNAEVAMAKNTLLEIALKQENKDVTKVSGDLKGSTIAIFGYNDPIAPIKALVEFAKKFELIKIKSGLVDDKYASAADVDTLSKLPSKEQLIAQVLGTMKSPLSGFVNVLSGTPRKLVYALSAIAKHKEVQ